MAGLEFSTGATAEVVGKPEPRFFEAAMEALKAEDPRVADLKKEGEAYMPKGPEVWGESQNFPRGGSVFPASGGGGPKTSAGGGMGGERPKKKFGRLWPNFSLGGGMVFRLGGGGDPPMGMYGVRNCHFCLIFLRLSVVMFVAVVAAAAADVAVVSPAGNSVQH